MIALDTHRAVFTWVQVRLVEAGLLNQTMVDLDAVGVRSYVAEPDRGRRDWSEASEAQAPVYGNRRRIRAVVLATLYALISAAPTPAHRYHGIASTHRRHVRPVRVTDRARC